MADIKAYQPESHTVGSGQVLPCPYSQEKARLVVHEMADSLALDLTEKGLVTDQVVLTVGYDVDSLKDPKVRGAYQGDLTIDRYGRAVPKHAHGTVNLEVYTASAREISSAVLELFDRIVEKKLWVRRIYLTAGRVVEEEAAPDKRAYGQLDLFTDPVAEEQRLAEEEAAREREKKMQKTMLELRKRFGKNAVLKGMNLEEGATAKKRNEQIGGHRA